MMMLNKLLSELEFVNVDTGERTLKNIANVGLVDATPSSVVNNDSGTFSL